MQAPDGMRVQEPMVPAVADTHTPHARTFIESPRL